jgi:hypothetical protein
MADEPPQPGVAFLEGSVESVEVDVGQQRRDDCSHAIANFEFERSVSRPSGRSQS